MKRGTRMQSPIFEPNNLPEIEAASGIEHALFVDPLLLMIGIGLISLLVCIALRTSGKPRSGLGVLGIGIVLVGACYLTSTLVTTEREVLDTRARLLVDAVAAGDEDAMESLMDEDLRVSSKFGSANNRELAIRLALSQVARSVQSHSVNEVRADLPGPRVGRTMIKVKVEGPTGSLSSWWMVHWERFSPDSGDWRTNFIEPVWIQGIQSP